MLELVISESLGAYKAKGFKLHETEDNLELWHRGVLVQRFSWHVEITDLQNACQCHLIKIGDFGGGISFGANVNV